MASNWRRKNIIKVNVNGVWQTSYKDVEQVVVEYFTNMFTSNGNTSYDKILDSVRGCLIHDINHSLCAAYYNAEIKEAIFQIDPHIAPGPEGMSFFFFSISSGILLALMWLML